MSSLDNLAAVNVVGLESGERGANAAGIAGEPGRPRLA